MRRENILRPSNRLHRIAIICVAAKRRRCARKGNNFKVKLKKERRRQSHGIMWVAKNNTQHDLSWMDGPIKERRGFGRIYLFMAIINCSPIALVAPLLLVLGPEIIDFMHLNAILPNSSSRIWICIAIFGLFVLVSLHGNRCCCPTVRWLFLGSQCMGFKRIYVGVAIQPSITWHDLVIANRVLAGRNSLPLRIMPLPNFRPTESSNINYLHINCGSSRGKEERGATTQASAIKLLLPFKSGAAIY